MARKTIPSARLKREQKYGLIAQLYNLAKNGFWLIVALVLVHTWHFLALPVPVLH